MGHASSAERKFELNSPAVACQVIDGEAILIHFDRGHYFSAVGTGAWLIQLLTSGLTEVDLVSAFVGHFGISRERALRAVGTALDQLLDNELVVAVQDAGGLGMPSTISPSAFAGEPLVYSDPVLTKFTDLEDLLALDPVHDVVALPLDVRLARLEHAFESASRKVKTKDYYIAIAGRRVKLSFASSELYRRLTPAFAHLHVDAGESEVSFCIADSLSTGVNPEVDVARFGEDLEQAQRADTNAVRCAYVTASEALFCFDPLRRLGFFWARSCAMLKPWDFASPVRLLLAWWAESVGAQLAHGAVVGNDEAAILFGGPSGVGKSTLTLACIQSGLLTLGDDYVWLEPGDPPKVASLYCTARIHAEALAAHFRDLERVAAPGSGDKACLYLGGSPGVRLVPALPLRAVAALSHSTRADPTLRTASAVDVLTALAPSSLLQLSGALPTGLERLAEIVEGTRTLAFEAGENYVRNAAAVRDLVRELAEQPAPTIRSQSNATKPAGERQPPWPRSSL